MSRKFRSSDTVSTAKRVSDAQWNKCNYYCITCNGFGRRGSTVAHDKSCVKSEVYAIPPDAEIPRKGASKRIWEIFRKQWVYPKYNVGWVGMNASWNYIHSKKVD